MAMDGTPIIIKKKKATSHAHHGGSWKVAYADFVTAMMAFFMVLWIMGLSDQTKTQVQGYFNDPLGYVKAEPKSRNIADIKGFQSSNPGEAKQPGTESATGPSKLQVLGDKLREIVRKLTGQSDRAGLSKNVDVTLNKDGVRIELIDGSGNVFFESGSAEFTPAGRRFVRTLAPMLAKISNRFVFEGHTDSVPYSAASDYDNYDLSVDRARALKTELRRDDVPPTSLTAIEGFGDTKPKFPQDPRSPLNRRVSILIPAKNIDFKHVDLTEGRIKADLKPDLHPETPKVGPTEPDLSKS